MAQTATRAPLPNPLVAAAGAFAFQRFAAEQLWVGTVAWWEAAARKPPSPRAVASSSTTTVVSAEVGYHCGGDYPPCSVSDRESGGSYSAFNAGGCGGNNCYGRWQFSGAWAGKLGLPEDLSTATPEQQDEAARQLWANGAGASHWGL